MDEAERARKKEILRRIIETLPPETRATIQEWKIDGILDAIEIVEKAGPLIRMIRRVPLPGPVFMERGGEHEEHADRSEQLSF